MANSNDPYKNPQGKNTWAGSTRQGQDEARKGQSPSPQQKGESHTSYTTRMGAYHTAKKKG